MGSRRTQADIAGLNSPGLYRFDKGLFLQVGGPDSKSWIYRFTVNRKARSMGLGSARDITLAKARGRLDEQRVQFVRNKIDPIAEQRQADAQSREATRNFRAHAARFMDAHGSKWRNEKHRAQWESTLRNHAFPVIGDLAPADITPEKILEVLRPIWAKRTTARRVRGRIRTVLEFAAGASRLSTYTTPLTSRPIGLSCCSATSTPRNKTSRRCPMSRCRCSWPALLRGRGMRRAASNSRSSQHRGPGWLQTRTDHSSTSRRGNGPCATIK